MPLHGCPKDPERSEIDAEAMKVLKRLLYIPQDACRESALHGIGHWANYYPEIANTVGEFLKNTPNLRPELIEYANNAKRGHVL